MATELKRMRQLYGTEAQWSSTNPTLLEGEIALSSDVKKFKVGPGAWSTLGYWGGDVSWDDLTGQQPPPIPHTHFEVDITNLDKYTKAEVDAKDAAVQGNLDDHIADDANPHDVTWDQTGAAPLVHTHVETDITDLDRIRWVSPYSEGPTYEKNDLVLDGMWSMVANKATTEKAAPQQDENYVYDMIDLPNWTPESHVGHVGFGRAYQTNEPITLVGYQIWLPQGAVDDDVEVSVRVFSYPVGHQEDAVFESVPLPSLQSDQWVTIAINRSLILKDTVFGGIVDVYDASETTTTTGQWSRATNSNDTETNPGAGNWGTANNNNSIRIHNTDYVGGGRKSELLALTAGSRITFTNATNPNESIEWVINAPGTDGGSDTVFTDVTYQGAGSGGEPGVGELCDMVAIAPVHAATPYVSIPLGNPVHSWGSSAGLLYFDGVEQAGENDAFGVRVLTDTWTVPIDWDVVSAIGSGGVAGASGGVPPVREFIDLLDTPSTYAGRGGQLAIVNQDEDALEFYAGTAQFASVPILTDNTKAITGGGVDAEQAAIAANNTDYSTFVGNNGNTDWDQVNAETGMVRVDPIDGVLIGFDGIVYTYLGPKRVYLGAVPSGGHTIPPEYSDYTLHTVTQSELVPITTSAHKLLQGLHYNDDTDPESGEADDHPQYFNLARMTNPSTGFLRLSGGTMSGPVEWIAGGQKTRIGTNDAGDNTGISFTTDENDYGGAIGVAPGVPSLNSTFELVPNGDGGNPEHELLWWHRLYFDDASKLWGIRQGASDADTVGVIADDEIVTIKRTDARYLKLTGGTLTGSLIIANALPVISLNADTGNKFIFTAYNNGYNIIENESTTGLLVSFDTASKYLFDPSGGLNGTSSVVTRANGDTRYLQLSGGMLTGTLEIASSNLDAIRLIRPSGTAARIAFDGDTSGNETAFFEWDHGAATFDFYSYVYGGNIGRIDADPAAAALSNFTLMTRDKSDLRYMQETVADTRYLQLSGGTLTGTVNFNAAVVANSTITYFRNDANKFLTFQNAASSVQHGQIISHTNGIMQIKTGGSPGSTFQFEQDGTVASNTTSVLTRASADARYLQTTVAANTYLQLSGGVLTGQLTQVALNNIIMRDGTKNLSFREADDTETGRIDSDETGLVRVLTRPGGTTVGTYRFEPAADLFHNNSVVTRSLGDARYMQQGGSTSISVAGITAAAGGVVAGSGFTCARTGTGQYTITWDTARAENSYVAVMTALRAGASGDIAMINTKTKAAMTIFVQNRNGNNTDADVNFMIIG